MSLERGGRGDKEGNRYEDRFFAKLLLELLLEKLVSIEVSETDEEKYLEACRDLLEAANIRYYFRCCAFEVLGQVPNPNRKHWELLSIIQTDPELVWTILQNVGTGTMQADELYDIVEVCTTPTTQIFSFRIQLLIDNTNLLLHDFVLYDLIEHGYIQAVSVMKTWVALEAGKRNSIHIPDENIIEARFNFIMSPF